ncbi:MAG: heat shock protein 90 [Alphaproteobacteria bacterium ADurb.Bin438]|nr:MAG: heat shock protein 90 [Alphaproteobacteria bacterium ADurb.Bin438]
MYKSSRVLDINSKHPLIKKLSELVKLGEKEEIVSNTILLIYDQALINEGESLKDPASFSDRIAKAIMAGL